MRGLMLIVPLLLLGISSVFGTTILGFVAISHIRHSAGRLYGMGLALFDALIFTLLVLDVAISLFVFRIPGMSRFAFAPLLAVTICIVLDFFIVRWAWRAANKGLVPIQPDSAFAAVSVIPAATEKGAEFRGEYAGEARTGAADLRAKNAMATQPAAIAVPTTATVPAANPMEKHVTLVAALNIGFGAIGILVGLFLFAVLTGSGVLSQDRTAMSITTIVGTALGGFIILTSVPKVIAGIGLLKRRGWARVLVLIIALLDLIEIPIGTAIGIYTLWVMLNNETSELFAQAAAERKNLAGRQ